MIFLAAAVSDYYIPEDKLSIDKIQSANEPLTITLYPVKKEMHKIKEEWNVNTFLVSFKLETNEQILIDKAHKSIKNGKSDYVVANLLQSRYDRVLILN